MFVLAIVVGLIVLFFLKELVLLGPIIAGLLAGVIAKGPIKGSIAGLVVALIGAIILTVSGIAANAFSGNFTMTGLTFFDTTEPLSLAKTIFSIGGVAIGTVAGLVGGLIRR